jgi:hypothetical protein
MASFLDNENEMITGALIQEVSDQLFEDWCNANLDESDIYADYRLLELAGDNYLYNRFNEFYGLKPGDEYYIEVA